MKCDIPVSNFASKCNLDRYNVVRELTLREGGAGGRAPLVVVDGVGTYEGALGGFDTAAENHAFHARVRKTTHTWCCFVNGTVDHVMQRYGNWGRV
jgi:hypothetical protein